MNSQIFIDCSVLRAGCDLATVVSSIGSLSTDTNGDGYQVVPADVFLQTEFSASSGSNTVHIDLSNGPSDWTTGLYKATSIDIAFL